MSNAMSGVRVVELAGWTFVPTAGAGLADRVAEDVKRLTNLRPTVEIVERDSIYDPGSTGKPRRIVDRRQAR